MTQAGGTSYTYDDNGNVTDAGAFDFSWDYRNRLTQVATGTATFTFAYDHTDQRIRKVASGATTTYVNRLYSIASTTSFATSTKHLFTPGGQLVATIEGKGHLRKQEENGTPLGLGDAHVFL